MSTQCPTGLNVSGPQAIGGWASSGATAWAGYGSASEDPWVTRACPDGGTGVDRVVLGSSGRPSYCPVDPLTCWAASFSSLSVSCCRTTL